MVQRELLTEEEVPVAKLHVGQGGLLLLSWALAEVEATLTAMQAENHESALADVRVAEVLAFFRATAFSLRGHCGKITNWLKNPPFPSPTTTASTCW